MSVQVQFHVAATCADAEDAMVKIRSAIQKTEAAHLVSIGPQNFAARIVCSQQRLLSLVTELIDEGFMEADKCFTKNQ